MDGGCLSIWVKELLSFDQRLLLKQYEIYLEFQGRGLSYSQEFRHPKFDSSYEIRQIKRALGYIPKQEIYICGLADPMFRAAEAICKYFNCYLQVPLNIDKIPDPKGEYYAIRKRNKWFIPEYDYHLVNWEFLAGYFNLMDEDEIRELYSLGNFNISV